MKKRNRNDDKGAIMVEASIYYPIVILTVFSMIYLGMLLYQESLLDLQVQRIAMVGAREVAYPGYVAFMGDGLGAASVDFNEGSDLSRYVEEYYEENAYELYKEWRKDYSSVETSLEYELTELLDRYTFLTGLSSNVDVTVDANLISKKITVRADYGLEVPKFLTYVGVPERLTLKTSVKQNASNPTELVRNTELAIDLVEFLLERFGVKDKVGDFLKKVEGVKNKLLH